MPSNQSTDQEQKMHLRHYSKSLFQIVSNSKLTNSQFLCQQGFTIDKFCCNDDCRFEALACSENECTTCLTQHEDCSFKAISQLVKKWQARVNRQKDLAKKLFQIEKEAIGKLIKSQQRFMESVQQGTYDPYSNILKEIRLRSGNSGRCGYQIQQIYGYLGKKQEIDAAEVIRSYQEQIKYVLFDIQYERVEVFNDCFRDQKVNNLKQSEPTLSKKIKTALEQMTQTQALLVDQDDISPQGNIEYAAQQCSQEQQSSSLYQFTYYKDEASYEQQQEQPAQSKKYPTVEWGQSTILNQDPNGQSKKDWLFHSLGSPKQLKLLFRASKNYFRSSKFHQACDGIDDTVTIVLTEPGCRVAGWTRLKWSTPNYFLEQAKEGDAFLLQLDLKEKYLPKKKNIKKSVYAHQNFGPSFGSELVISDQCNFNLESRSCFPQFYNHPTKKYKSNKKNKALLCGCEDGYFRIGQYEVFKVIRQ